MRYSKLTIFLIGLTLFLSGCQMGPSSTAKLPINETLPTVSNIKTLSDMDAIAFEWTPINDGIISGYYIYRVNTNNSSAPEQRVAMVDDRYVSHYVDTKLEPRTTYTYSMSTYSAATKQESLRSASVTASTTANIEPVPFLTTVNNLPNRTKLIWRPHPSERVSSYIIERSDLARDNWRQIATIDGRLNAEYIDTGLSDSKGYRYRVKVKTYDGLISEPTETVNVQTKDLPLMIENLSATNNLPKRIVLSWNASTESDFSYYKVYRSSSQNMFFSYYAKTDQNIFEDLINDNGIARYYYVTAVDKDELESPRQKVSTMGSTLASPKEPIVSMVKYDTSSVQLGWSDVSQRAVKYQVVKVSANETKTFTNINQNNFIDTEITPKSEYTYTIFAIDEYGLMSKASEKIVVVIPEY